MIYDHLKDNEWKPNIHAGVSSADMPTVVLLGMGVKAVERRNVEDIMDEDDLPAKRNDGGAAAYHRGKGVVPHVDTDVIHLFVEDKFLLVSM